MTSKEERDALSAAYQGMRGLFAAFSDERPPKSYYGTMCGCADLLRVLHQPHRALEFIEPLAQGHIDSFADVKIHLRHDLALIYFAADAPDKALEVIEYYALRPYLVGDGTMRTFFCWMACVAARQRDDYKALRFFVRQLARMPEADGFLLRFYKQTGGMTELFRIVSFPLWFRMNMRLFDLLHILAARSMLGKLALKGYRFCMSACIQVAHLCGLNQIHNLPRRADTGQGVVSAELQKARRPVLVTRAMGGIGDILMMTPGLAVLKKKYPEREIHFAIPKGFHGLLLGNTDVEVKDIHADVLHQDDYSLWYDLTRCPAARVESMTLPRVRANRIDIYAAAMGVKRKRLAEVGRIPRYMVTPEEQDWADNFLREHGLVGKDVFGIHLYSADSYKDYPHFEEVARQLALKNPVLLFHGETIQGFDIPNIIKVDSHPLRRSIALVQRCRCFIAPDSGLLHAAAALHVPTVALFGPTCGKVFTRHYPHVRMLDARERFPCVPCWRNQGIVCAVSGKVESVCMERLSPDAVLAATVL